MKPAPPVTKIMQLPYQSNKHGLFFAGAQHGRRKASSSARILRE
jgi:hypothetical protein